MYFGMLIAEKEQQNFLHNLFVIFLKKWLHMIPNKGWILNRLQSICGSKGQLALQKRLSNSLFQENKRCSLNFRLSVKRNRFNMREENQIFKVKAITIETHSKISINNSCKYTINKNFWKETFLNTQSSPAN